MRELTMKELDQVSGAGVNDALGLWGAGFAIGTITYGSSWGTVAALTAFAVSPVGALSMVALALAGGYQLLQD